MKLTGENRSTQRKTCPSTTLSTTNPTWTDPGSNPGLRGERPATYCLSHGTARQETNLNITIRGRNRSGCPGLIKAVIKMNFQGFAKA
jgi:hypothetical protein